jgi:uncharacterized heparinase superfamily protein
VPSSSPSRSPRAGLWPEIAGRLVLDQIRAEWRGSPLHLAGLDRPRAEGWAAQPRDLRPPSQGQAEAMLAGAFTLAGETLEVGPGGDPWARPSPSRRFAVALHRFEWLGALVAGGEAGALEALRLTEAWGRLFGRWNAFAWSDEVIERRVFNLACAGRAIAPEGPAAAALAQSLARQARHLASLAHHPPRKADQLAAAAVAAACLAGRAGGQLLARTLPRLTAALDAAVLPDGGHRSRSPEAGLELLLDLLALEDGLGQRGEPPPEPMLGAIARLSAGLVLLTLPDGGLPALQGGGASEPARIAAARLAGAKGEPQPGPASVAGYQRLDASGLAIIADAEAPAHGDWSLAACGQPLAIAAASGADRLFTSSGWTPGAAGPQALRLADAASTAVVERGQAGAPLAGLAARVLGPRLVGGATTVVATRREDATGIWLDLSHDGWAAAAGLTHERRLFLDKGAGELRGEDRFVPLTAAKPVSTPVAIYFHLPPEVTATLARDQRSVLLRGRSDIGWWLRNDAGEVSVEPSVDLADGRQRRSKMVVMRGRLRADRGGRIRWKLTLAEPAVDGGAAPIDRGGAAS